MHLRRYVALAVPAALLALAACSGGSGSGPAASSTPGTDSPLRLIQATYARTTSAKTARVFVRAVNSLPDFGYPALLSWSGVEDFQHRRLQATSSDGTVQGRVIGADVYLQVPKEAMGGPGPDALTKPWLHLHVDSQGDPSLGLARVLGNGSIDPVQFVKLLTSVSSSVARVGTSPVRGQQSTHYRISFDAAKVAKLDASLGQCSADMSGSDAATPLDVWLDAQGRLTRLTVSHTELVYSAIGQPTGMPSSFPSSFPTEFPDEDHLKATPRTVTTTVELYDYGTPVKVTPPPASQTQDWNDIGSPGGSASASPTPCPTR